MHEAAERGGWVDSSKRGAAVAGGAGGGLRMVASGGVGAERVLFLYKVQVW